MKFIETFFSLVFHQSTPKNYLIYCTSTFITSSRTRCEMGCSWKWRKRSENIVVRNIYIYVVTRIMWLKTILDECVVLSLQEKIIFIIFVIVSTYLDFFIPNEGTNKLGAWWLATRLSIWVVVTLRALNFKDRRK